MFQKILAKFFKNLSGSAEKAEAAYNTGFNEVELEEPLSNEIENPPETGGCSCGGHCGCGRHN